MDYIALPTVYRRIEDNFRIETEKGAPWKIYAFAGIGNDRNYVKIAEPPYYKVVGVREGKPVLEKLVRGSNEFNKMCKWVGECLQDTKKDDGLLGHPLERKILNYGVDKYKPGGLVDEKRVMELLTENNK